MIRRLVLATSLAALLARAAPAQRQPLTLRAGDVEVGGGVSIHYLEGGRRGAAPTLLFVPGWCFAGSVWREQLEALAAGARVVAIDPRSQGDSSITPHGNTPEQRAEDVRQVMRALGLRDVVLVGWSQGVQDVAAYAAAFRGDGVAAYVLVDSTLGAGAAATTAEPALLRQQLERLAIYRRHPREYLQGMLGAIIQSPAGRARLDEYVETGLRTPPDLGAAMLLWDFVAIDRRPALASFDRPTLVVAAASSPELAGQRAMAAEIAGSEMAVVEEAGHALFLDQPQRFRDLLVDFLRRRVARSES